jgi:hypothetical protein
MISARQAATLLGGEVIGNSRILCPGPGHDPQDRSLQVNFQPEGFIVHSFAPNDPWPVCKDHVRALLGLEPWRPSARRVIPRSAFRPAPKAILTEPNPAAMRLWAESADPRGTLVELYLHKRGLELPEVMATEVCRFHPSLFIKETGDTAPGMVTLFRHLKTDTPWAVQRTFLGPDGNRLLDLHGHKMNRKYTGSPDMAAIKLTPECDVQEGLHLGEGLESCLGAWHLGLRPVWAAGDAGHIASFPVLNGVEAISILGERNSDGSISEANECAAYECMLRWEIAGCEFHHPMPKAGDFNDAWIAAQKSPTP